MSGHQGFCFSVYWMAPRDRQPQHDCPPSLTACSLWALCGQVLLTLHLLPASLSLCPTVFKLRHRLLSASDSRSHWNARLRLSQERSEVIQSCPTLWDPMDYSLPSSYIHGIFQTRRREWVAISFSGNLPNPGIKPRSRTLRADSLQSEPPGKFISPRSPAFCLQILNTFTCMILEAQFLSQNIPLSPNRSLEIPAENTEGTSRRGLPAGPVVKNLPFNAGDTGSIPGCMPWGN